MSQKIHPSTPEINRLRAAAALIPIIESGLLESKLSVERAALLVSFCEWAVEKPSDDPEVVKLAESVASGLKRIKMALPSAGWRHHDCRLNLRGNGRSLSDAWVLK